MTTPDAKDNAHRLDFIRPRVTRRIQRARDGRAAQVMRKMRVWLPSLAGAVIVLLMLWPHLLPSFTMSALVKEIPDLVIDNLHYTGMDEKNQAYSLSAQHATRPNNLHGIYDLTKPEGEITLQSGAWIDGKADYGRYDEIGKKLWLGGNVRFFHDKGYQMTSEEAQINLNNNEAWGDKSVLIQGPFGTIRGVGFRFLQNGHTLIVNGPATALLSLQSNTTSDTPLPQ